MDGLLLNFSGTHLVEIVGDFSIPSHLPLKGKRGFLLAWPACLSLPTILCTDLDPFWLWQLSQCLSFPGLQKHLLS
jgi:hypothetical protein